MYDQYSMHLMSWWALFGLTVTLGLSLSDDDDNHSSSPGPDPDPVPEPFQGREDFDPNAYDEIWVGDSGDNALTADRDVSHAMAGLGGNDTLTGSYERDYILGGAGDDEIMSRLDSDIVYAGDGNDFVNSGWQNDFVSGGRGDDTINGLYGNDVLLGDEGNDQIIGFDGQDTIDGGAGNDTLSGFKTGQAAISNAADPDADGADILIGGDGDDELWLAADDTGQGGAGADTFITDHRFGIDEGSAIISDYNADEDQIYLLVDPTPEGEEPPEITQNVSENGEDRLILVNGVEVAQVTGAGAGDDLDIQTVTEFPSEDEPQPEEQPVPLA
ncbi:calcium-binding protein [Paracoccus onubensis]|uniref:calcium-binding protein n=1 Tax=Paracoccus onubensis TaxID=1675788 RepID=UPI00273130AA|nr:calcium-binding protein [Paracoccus onubensis]MDP0926026.1 calcium-binding protein [Paracoccus onubensis]